MTDESKRDAWRATRRRLLAGVGAASAFAGLVGCPKKPAPHEVRLSEPYSDLLRPGYPAVKNDTFANAVQGRPPTAEWVSAMHTNFYEFGTDKTEVYAEAKDFVPRPWTIAVGGDVERPLTLDLDDIEGMGLEERIYRFRCVEAWASIVPWTGLPLARLIARCKPLSSARFVRFEAFYRPSQAPGQRRGTSFQWPYYEALKMKDAVHPLAFLATGIYGHALPKQHGAPVRLVVPWKYGYKSIKSIAKITFSRTLPTTFWADLVPREYTFDALVNPKVPHPRWSQAYERLIDTREIRASLWLNGYGPWLDERHPRQPAVPGWQDAPRPFRH